jgi:ankyrin repeat protein
MIACESNDVKMITMLLNNKKTNLNKSDQPGRTALYIACYKSNYDLANLLVQKGANTNILIKQGFTLLDWACQEEIDPKIIKLLRDNKAQNGWKFILTIYKPIITTTIFMIIYMSHISNNKTIRIALLSLAISLAILQKYSL